MVVATITNWAVLIIAGSAGTTTTVTLPERYVEKANCETVARSINTEVKALQDRTVKAICHIVPFEYPK